MVMGMAELIDKWDVVNKLIQLENNYNFYKDVWDAQTLYRRICELEIGIGKTPGLEVVRCKDCKYWNKEDVDCVYGRGLNYPFLDDFCSSGERREGE